MPVTPEFAEFLADKKTSLEPGEMHEVSESSAPKQIPSSQIYKSV